MVMRTRVKKVDPVAASCSVQGKRFYFEAQNGMRVSVRGRNGLIAAKSLPSWMLL